jgi:hypothetical protein
MSFLQLLVFFPMRGFLSAASLLSLFASLPSSFLSRFCFCFLPSISVLPLLLLGIQIRYFRSSPPFPKFHKLLDLHFFISLIHNMPFKVFMRHSISLSLYFPSSFFLSCAYCTVPSFHSRPVSSHSFLS